MKTLLRGLAAAALAQAGLTAQAAPCPGDPEAECEMGYVYRIQTWPGYREDAGGIDLLSLREANAGDLAAFRDIFAGYKQGGSLALRFRVSRLAGEPKSYCNCNFEIGNVACKAPIDDAKLKTCVRRCLSSGKACTWSGFDVKTDGRWFAFPASTEYAAGKVWKKNVFKVDAKSADWSAEPPAIRRAECIAQALAHDKTLKVDTLFDTDAPCKPVTQAELQKAAKAR